jgi:hypothetical protein
MWRRSAGVFANENRTFAMPVLRLVATLKEGYESGPDELHKCEETVVRIKGLLRTEDARRALQELLAEQAGQRAVPVIGGSDEALAEEAELARLFGYSRKDIKRYLRKAREEPRPAEELVRIADVEDLARHLDALHARVTEAMTTSGSPIARWRRRRSGLHDARDSLFCIGAIVADTMVRSLFRLSYSLAVAGLSTATRDE